MLASPPASRHSRITRTHHVAGVVHILDLGGEVHADDVVEAIQSEFAECEPWAVVITAGNDISPSEAIGIADTLNRHRGAGDEWHVCLGLDDEDDLVRLWQDVGREIRISRR